MARYFADSGNPNTNTVDTVSWSDFSAGDTGLSTIMAATGGGTSLQYTPQASQLRTWNECRQMCSEVPCCRYVMWGHGPTENSPCRDYNDNGLEFQDNSPKAPCFLLNQVYNEDHTAHTRTIQDVIRCKTGTFRHATNTKFAIPTGNDRADPYNSDPPCIDEMCAPDVQGEVGCMTAFPGAISNAYMRFPCCAPGTPSGM